MEAISPKRELVKSVAYGLADSLVFLIGGVIKKQTDALEMGRNGIAENLTKLFLLIENIEDSTLSYYFNVYMIEFGERVFIDNIKIDASSYEEALEVVQQRFNGLRTLTKDFEYEAVSK